MIIDSAQAREIAVSSTTTACAKAIAMPKGFWIAHAITITTGIGLQLLGKRAGQKTAVFAMGGQQSFHFRTEPSVAAAECFERGGLGGRRTIQQLLEDGLRVRNELPIHAPTP